METKTDKLVNFFRSNFLTLILVIVTFAYLFLDFFDFGLADKTWYELIGIFTVNFAFGYAINSLISNEGLKAGQESPKYKTALKTYGDEKIKTDAFSEFAEDFCDKYNVRQHERIMFEYYRSYNLKYDLVKENKYDLTKLTKKQNLAIKRADKLKILNISPKYLFSLSNKPYRSEKETDDIAIHIVKRDVKKLVSKVILAVAFTFLAWDFVQNPSWANFLSSLIKVATWLVIGSISYFQEYQFITADYLQNVVIDKTDLLVQFRNEYEKGLLKVHDKPVESVLEVKEVNTKEVIKDALEVEIMEEEKASCNELELKTQQH